MLQEFLKRKLRNRKVRHGYFLRNAVSPMSNYLWDAFKRSGMTVKELAKESGLPKKEVELFVEGGLDSSCRVIEIVALADALGIKVSISPSHEDLI